MKVRGPYIYPSGRCVGRRYVVVIQDDGSKRQLMYSRWLMEQHLGRRLSPKDHVHHKNDDKTDDRLDNLEVIPIGQHSSQHRPPREMVSFVCPECGVDAEKPASIVRHNRKKGGVGPFCGRSCAGTYNRRVQLADVG